MLDNIGLPYSGINLSYSNAGTIGTPDAEILVSLKEGHRPTSRIREAAAGGTAAAISRPPSSSSSRRTSSPRFSNFGVPAPIDVQIAGADQLGNYNVARQLANRIRAIPAPWMCTCSRRTTLPRCTWTWIGPSRNRWDLSQRDVASNLLVSLSSSFQTSPTFWLNPKNGISYNVAVQTPQYRVDSVKALLDTPIRTPASPNPQILGNLASFRHANQPAVISHYNVQPLVDVFASVQGRDLGGVASDVRRVIQTAPKATSARQPLDHHRTGVHHVSVVHRTGRRRGDGHRARLPADRGEFPIVARPVHHHHRAARRIGWNHLGIAADSHHSERAVAHRRHHVRGRGHRQQHSDGLLRARADGRRDARARGRRRRPGTRACGRF